jgi:hypothetical protein
MLPVNHMSNLWLSSEKIFHVPTAIKIEILIFRRDMHSSIVLLYYKCNMVYKHHLRADKNTRLCHNTCDLLPTHDEGTYMSRHFAVSERTGRRIREGVDIPFFLVNRLLG